MWKHCYSSFRVDKYVVITAAAVWMVGTGLPLQLCTMVLHGLASLHLLVIRVLLWAVVPFLRWFTALWRLLLRLPQGWVWAQMPTRQSEGSPAAPTSTSPALPTPRRPPDLPHVLLPPWWRPPRTLWAVLPCPMMCLRHLPHWGQLVIVKLQRLLYCLILGTADLYIEIRSHGYHLVKHNFSGSAERGREEVIHKLKWGLNESCLNQTSRSTSATWNWPPPATPRLYGTRG